MEIKIKHELPTEYTFKDVVVNFLEENGMTRAEDYINDIGDGALSFQPKCANNDYTRAVSLLLLLTINDEDRMYVTFGKDGGAMVIEGGYNEGHLQNSIALIKNAVISIKNN